MRKSNLLERNWQQLDSAELRILLAKRIGGPGQYDSREKNPNNTLYLPLARSSCKVKLTFKNTKIVAVEPGPAFDAVEWTQVRDEVQNSLLAGPVKVGREYSFCTFRVLGSWRGARSGVQVLPAPAGAPRANIEIADHPFILEFPLTESALPEITNHRRIREHRRLTLLLNVLLAGRTSFQPTRSESLWANVPTENDPFRTEWVQQSFLANLGSTVTDSLSKASEDPIEELDSREYYASGGHDGGPLRVPSDLDASICRYLHLSPANRDKFDRAAFWMDMASRQWTISVSSSFASLVSAIESLTQRGTIHHLYCDKCKRECQHEVPGATERFRAFLEKYAPGVVHKKQRTEMYSLRSGILHGSEVMQLDQDLAFGWDPPGWNERELHRELWSVTRIALRNWLRDPSDPGARETSTFSKRRSALVMMGLGGLILWIGGAIFAQRKRRMSS